MSSWISASERPQPHLRVKVLARDQEGVYELPFLCRYWDGKWRNALNGQLIEIRIISWKVEPIILVKPNPISDEQPNFGRAYERRLQAKKEIDPLQPSHVTRAQAPKSAISDALTLAIRAKLLTKTGSHVNH